MAQALKNPTYAGVYTFGKTREVRTVLPDESVRSTRHRRARENCVTGASPGTRNPGDLPAERSRARSGSSRSHPWRTTADAQRVGAEMVDLPVRPSVQAH
ncbi:hypothetical protein [Micromonospora sp. RTGN7]|uniref:hypothetical protein n=1 Tax=Micromonospora sp. RTGN7 TaxID=3016526 RepID=UPI0039B7001D